MRHAISVDVEDWGQLAVSEQKKLSDRFERNVGKVLEAFANHGVKGTFFVLGFAAESAPNVVKAIANAGHEIQSHGYGHLSNFELDESAFREDVTRAKKLLEDIALSLIHI